MTSSEGFSETVAVPSASHDDFLDGDDIDSAAVEEAIDDYASPADPDAEPDDDQDDEPDA